MPTGPLADWTPSYSDDFNHSSFAGDTAWSAYSGQPSGDSISVWSPSHDVESNGTLKLESRQSPVAVQGQPAGTWVTGGVKTKQAQTYGKWLVRFRIDQGAGISLTALLWPADNSWPPEVDFAEDNGDAAHTLNTASMHYGSASSAGYVVRSVGVDMTQWHTLGVEWTPGEIAYTLDGQAWATVISSHVPSVPMDLALQTAVYGCQDSWRICPNAQTPSEVDMDVDWVAAYSYAP